MIKQHTESLTWRPRVHVRAADLSERDPELPLGHLSESSVPVRLNGFLCQCRPLD